MKKLSLLTVSLLLISAAPPGRYTVTADVVVDTVTGLTWQRAYPQAFYSWSSAKSYCQSLVLGGFSSGWRVPTVKELETLVDEAATSPAIDGSAFPGTVTTQYYWTSTAYAYNSAGLFAWYVNFADGSTSYQQLTSNSLVRCVR